MPRIKVIGARSEEEHSEALRLAKRYQSLVGDVGGYRIGYHPARSSSEASYVVRKFPDRIEVVVLRSETDVTLPVDVELRNLRRPVHGFVVSTRIYNAGKRLPVVVRDPLRGYLPRPSWQITHPIFREFPRGFQSHWSFSKWKSYYSHLVKVRPTMYSGHMREVVQLGNAIGFGSEDPERRHDFYRPLYRLTSDISDGVVFVPSGSNEPPGVMRYGVPFELLRPVVVRVDQIRGKVYAAKLTYWDEAWADDPAVSSPELRDFDRWMKWARTLKKVKPNPDKDLYPDPYVERVVSIYGGWPSSEPLFETKITCTNAIGKPDLAETLRQRISAGLVAEADISEIRSFGHAIGPSMGWAFSYMMPAAYSVLVDYSDSSGVPYSRLVTLSFNVSFPEPLEPTRGGGALTEFVSYWVSKGVLDSLASERKLAFLPESDLERFTREVRDTLASGGSYDSLEPLAKDFAKASVPKPSHDLSLTVSVSTGLSGFVDNPVRRTSKGLKPEIEVKYPEYLVPLKSGPTLGNVTWVPSAELGSTPPVRQVAPISVFESRDRGIVVSLLASAETNDDGPEIYDPDVPCWVDRKETRVRDYSKVARQFGSTLINSHFSDREYTKTTKSIRACSFVGVSVSSSDYLYNLDTGESIKRNKYLCSRKDIIYSEVSLKTHGIFPLFEREGSYVGFLPHGKGVGTEALGYYKSQVTYYWIVLHGRCFGGYWTPPPGYHDCGDTKYLGGRCPSYAWDPVPAGGFPRRAVNIRYLTYPSPCLHHVGMYAPWAYKCMDLDAESKKNTPDPPAPPSTVRITDPDLRTYIEYVGSTVSARTDDQRGKDVSISGWWPTLSPDPDTDLVAFIFAYENCSGAKAAIVWRDITRPEPLVRSGAAKRFPLNSMSHILAVGVPVDD